MKKKTNNTKIFFVIGISLLILIGLVTTGIFADTQDSYNCMSRMGMEDKELMREMHGAQNYEEMENEMEEHMGENNMNDHMKNMMGMH